MIHMPDQDGGPVQVQLRTGATLERPLIGEDDASPQVHEHSQQHRTSTDDGLSWCMRLREMIPADNELTRGEPRIPILSV